jgi:NlpC/P60 family putative phage cell wall peptidase
VRDRIVAEARKYLGTPYHHQGRVLGHGIDCYGLVEMVARGLGFDVPEGVRYSRIPDEAQLLAYMDQYAVQVDKRSYQLADILIVPFRGQMRHMAIVTEIGMIHAYEPSGMVVEHAIDDKWARRIARAYSFKEVVNG